MCISSSLASCCARRPPTAHPLVLSGAAAAVLSELGSLGVSSISIQSSTTLQLLPFDLSAETQLPADVVSRLAFAVQKLDIITDLAKIITSGGKVPESKVNDPNVDVDPSLFKRPVSYEERRAKQVRR